MNSAYYFFFAIAAAVIVSVSGCKSQEYSPETYPDKQLMFGSGGGFSGLVSTYVLLENGRIYDKPPTGDAYSRLTKISRKKAHEHFETAEELSNSEDGISEPGNIYHFVWLISSTDTVSWTWGNPQKQPSEELEQLYKTLMEETRPGP